MKHILLISLLLYFGLGLFLYLKQRSFIYFPVAEISTNLDSRVFNNKIKPLFILAVMLKTLPTMLSLS